MTTGAGVLTSRYLGQIAWNAESELFLPFGLPGFEGERRMAPVEIPAQRPLVFLQSMDHPEVCFVTLPAGTISPGFCLRLTEDDKSALLLEDPRDPVIGVGVLCLVLLLPGDGSLQANLDAPIVINLRNLRCVQSVMEPLNGYFRLYEDGQWRRIC